MESEAGRSLLRDLLEDAAARFNGLAHVVIPADYPSGIAEHENVAVGDIREVEERFTRRGDPIHCVAGRMPKGFLNGH